MSSACTGNVICVIICTAASLTQSLNQTYIRLAAERLSRRLLPFADTVLQSRAIRDIYTAAHYDMFQINGSQVVHTLSSALGNLTPDMAFDCQ